MQKKEEYISNSPAIVTAYTPDSDAYDGLRMKDAAIHGVNQIQHVVLQDKIHVFPLIKTNQPIA